MASIGPLGSPPVWNACQKPAGRLPNGPEMVFFLTAKEKRLKQVVRSTTCSSQRQHGRKKCGRSAFLAIASSNTLAYY